VQSETQVRVHATTIAWQGCAALIMGASGSGKSSLALHLMALGCDLIADDQTEICVEHNQLIARCPAAILGQIEARGFGILKVNTVSQARVVCAIDLDASETKRLPVAKFVTLCARHVRVFHKPGIEVLPFALLQYLKMNSRLQPSHETSSNEC
jgi:HPr kinase/phosphorylase